ncbi:hypothetical protein B0H16DRAFT_1712833 [Mycena metata]|uniref:F-box domain-containing protein n=1 Tax=Mycena metata TaxID=1033252 RepID=A0AAD7NVA5_9AGAR|nr:hypothetical protein B0H16DRAFT_1712833 [Mycena metata]
MDGLTLSQASSSAGSLPADVLATIMMEATVSQFKDTPFGHWDRVSSAANVCSHWRSVALSDSRLWAFIFADYYTPTWILELGASRSRGRALILHIQIHSTRFLSRRGSPPPAVPRFLQTVFGIMQNSPCASLAVDSEDACGSMAFMNHFPLTSFTTLMRFTCGLHEYPYSAGSGSIVLPGSLNSIIFIRNIFIVSFPATLVELSLEDVVDAPCAQLILLLQKCTRVIRLRLQGIYCQGRDGGPKVVLPALRELEVHIQVSPCALLEYIDAPFIRSLHLSVHNTSALLIFVRRTKEIVSRVAHLDLRVEGLQAAAFVSVLGECSSVRSIAAPRAVLAQVNCGPHIEAFPNDNLGIL